MKEKSHGDNFRKDNKMFAVGKREFRIGNLLAIF